MSAKVSKLLDEKNADGVPFKRGSFSRRIPEGRREHLPGHDAPRHDPG
jgi:hypothetical protein